MIGKLKIYLKNIWTTIYFNFKFLPLKQAIYLPIIVSKTVLIDKKSKGKVLLDDLKNRGEIYVGFPCLNTCDRKNERSVIHIDGTLIFRGKAFLAQGAKIDIRENGVLDLGNAFNSTGKMELICFKKIIFEEDCTVSWDTLIMDSDAHSIFDSENHTINFNAEVRIGRHSWIGCRSVVLKGVNIASGSIIASSSVITKSIIKDNTIVGGNPQRELKSNIFWDLITPE